MRYAVSLAMTVFLWGSMSRAANPPDPPGRGSTPPRLSFADGDVSFWRQGAEDWSPARRNTPIAQGDALYAAADANLEVEAGRGVAVRAGDDTEVTFDTIASDFLQLRMRGGHLTIDASGLPNDRRIEVETPAAAFTMDAPGIYRVDVGPDRTRFAVRRGGPATATSEKGDPTGVESGQEIAFEGTNPTAGDIRAAADPDAWDRWNDDRSNEVEVGSAGESARHLPKGVSGAADLDQHGSWHDAPQYGSVWVPQAVPVGWAPYSAGRWIYDPYFGWTWIDDAPWGWAPFHYGRWVTIGGVWSWAPGPIVVAPFYSPALVAFFGTPGLSVSVSVGPTVGWVPLGWGEPLVPWWGYSGFVGVPCWHGWGGPRVVNNVIIQHNTYVNVQNITHYQHQNALIATHGQQFGRGKWERVNMAKGERALEPIHGHVPLRPTHESFAAAEGRGHRPPEWIEGRRVVATRTPARLHPIPEGDRSSAGARTESAAPHIVSAPPARWERHPQRPTHLRASDARPRPEANAQDTSARRGRELRTSSNDRPSSRDRSRSRWDAPRHSSEAAGPPPQPRPQGHVTSHPGWGTPPPRRPSGTATREPGSTAEPPRHPAPERGGGAPSRGGWTQQSAGVGEMSSPAPDHMLSQGGRAPAHRGGPEARGGGSDTHGGWQVGR